MKPMRRRPNTVTIIPERKHARPAGIRLITRSTTVRPFVYSLPSSEHSEEPPPADSKRSKRDTSENNNTTMIPLDQNSVIASSSFYSSTPTASQRKRRYINRTLLKSFDSSQDATEKDAQKKDLHQKPLLDLHQGKLTVSEKLRSPKITSPQKTPQKVPIISQPEFGDHLPREDLVIDRKHSSVRSPEISHKGSQRRHSARILALNKRSNQSPVTRPEFRDHLPHEELITNRKHSYARSAVTSHEGSQIRHSPRILALNKRSKQNSVISPPELSSSFSEEEKIVTKRKSKLSVNAAVLHEVLQETSLEANKTVARSKIQSVDSPEMQSPSRLTQVPSIVKQTSLTSLTTLEENYIEKKKLDVNLEDKDDSKQETPYQINSVFVKESIVTQQTPPRPISKTSTPIELKPVGETNKNLVHISQIIPDEVSTVAVEENQNHSLADVSAVNKRSGKYVAQRAMEDNANTSENIQDTFCESNPDIKSNKCSVMLDNLKCLIWEGVKQISTEEKESENNEVIKQHPAIDDENAKGKKEQEKDIVDGKLLTNVNDNNKKEETVVISATPTKHVSSFSHSPLESNILQLKNQSEHIEEKNTLTKLPDTSTSIPQSISTNKDTEQELLLVSSLAPIEPRVTCVLIENTASNINSTLTKQILKSPQLACVHNKSPATDTTASKLKVQPQNVASENHEPRQTLEEVKPFTTWKNKLRQTSNKQLTYNAIVGNIRRSVPRQPKRKRKTKLHSNSSVYQSPDKQPLFQEHKKIMLWKGAKGERKISDLSDLDVALNAIDQVIEEISEEDQRKQKLLNQIQEKYHHSVHEMIRNVHFIKKKKKETKELMAKVKDLAGELDQVVDRKVRLHSEFLDLKAQIKASKTTGGPTWEDISHF